MRLSKSEPPSYEVVQEELQEDGLCTEAVKQLMALGTDRRHAHWTDSRKTIILLSDNCCADIAVRALLPALTLNRS